MSQQKKDLTISLLSSGRTGTIERCLSSLMPFKEQLDTEIIVVDTDPVHREDVYEILEKYADRIIPFEWRDDFSAARNAGIKAASGEWFLYIDDDEWFIEAQPLVEFFKSGKAEGCKQVTCRIRNYINDDLTVYNDSLGNRAFRLDGRVRFRSRVHEYIEPEAETEPLAEVMIGHTGYVFHSDAERRTHAMRNIALLEKMRSEEPGQVRWTMQLMAQYGGLEDHEHELSLALEGYNLMKGARGYRRACIRGLFAADIVRLHRQLGDYEGCIEAYRRIRRKGSPLGKVSAASMELNVAQAMYLKGDHASAKEHFDKYLACYDMLHDSPIEYAEDYTYFLMNTFRSAKHILAQTFLICADLRGNSWDSFDKMFSEIEWDVAEEGSAGELGKEFLRSAARMPYDFRLSTIIQVFWRFEPIRRAAQELILELDQGAEASAPADPDTKISAGLTDDGQEDAAAVYWNLVRAVAETDGLHPDPLDIRIIWDDHEGIREQMPDYFRRLFVAVNPLQVDPLLWRIGLRRGAVLDERIAEIPMERWQACVEEYVHQTSLEHIRRMAEIMDDVYLGMADERYEYFRMRTDGALRQADEKQKYGIQESARTEMKQIIDSLQKKVDELVSAGMIEEADSLLMEIQKYTDKIN